MPCYKVRYNAGMGLDIHMYQCFCFLAKFVGCVALLSVCLVEVYRMPALRIGVGWDGERGDWRGKKDRDSTWPKIGLLGRSQRACNEQPILSQSMMQRWLSYRTTVILIDRCTAASKAAAVAALTALLQLSGCSWFGEFLVGKQTDVSHKTASSRVSSTHLSMFRSPLV